MSVAPDQARTLSLLSVAAFASMASMRLCDSLLPALASSFAVTTGQAAQVISAFAVAYGLSQLFYGPMGDRYGKFRVVSLATLACTLGSVGAALSPTLGWLTLSRFLSGACAAGIIPLTMAWIGDNVPYERRQEVLAQLLGATVFGMIAGQWAGGLLADTLGWRFGFVMLALLFASISVLLAVRQRRNPAAPDRAPPASMLTRTLTVLAVPWARRVLAVSFLEGALVYSAITFVVSHLHGRFGLSMTAAAAILALYGVGGLLYSRCARWLVPRIGESGLAATGGIGLAVAFGTLAWLPFWHAALPACVLAGFGFYALHNTLQTNATQMAPAARGTAVSLFACSLFLGQSFGVLGAAWIVDRFSAAAMFAVVALALLVLGSAFAAMLARRHRGVAMRA
ncbi:MAG: arabinose transporter permease [Rhizobacter sp.]|nr:arabinose transporter permease [Rhizobacter sp.]